MGLNKHDFKYYPLDQFTDPTVRKVFENRYTEIQTAKKSGSQQLEQLTNNWLKEAKRNRGTEKRELGLTSACIYLLLAQNGQDQKSTATMEAVDQTVMYFHFAANELRQRDMLEAAAQCYFNSALRDFELARKKKFECVPSRLEKTIEFGLRSAGRGKGLFNDLGEEEKEDEIHVLRLDIKKLELTRKNNLFLPSVMTVWRISTKYGTSPGR